MKKMLLYIILGLFAFLAPIYTQAYVLNNQYIGYNITYQNQPSVAPYTTHANKITTWNYNGGKVYLSTGEVGYFINIYQNFTDVDNGTYGTCYYLTSRQSNIVYYNAFKRADSAKRNETVVHEVGHAIGLSHTQEENNSIAVMRRLGFNGKAYPLSDDKAGINAKY